VQTRTPNLNPKIRDISHRWDRGCWKGLLPKNYFDLLPSRGYKHSTVRVTLESPADIMGPGNMPVFPANLRKYEYDDIRKNLMDAQVTLSKWTTGRNEAGKKIKNTWDKIFHGLSLEGHPPDNLRIPTAELFKIPTTSYAAEWCPRFISLENIDQQYSSEDIRNEWVENNQNMCTTIDGFHPTQHVWDIVNASPNQDIQHNEDDPEHTPDTDSNGSEEEAVELTAELKQDAASDENVSVTIEEFDDDEAADFGGEEVELQSISPTDDRDSQVITAACPSAL